MTDSQSRAEANKALVQRFVEEVWNQGNVAAIDELVAPDFVEHALWPNVMLNGPAEASPRDQISHDVAAFRGGLPDLSVTVDQLLDTEDKVTAVTTHRGTPTHRDAPISWADISIYRISDGKIAEVWILWDRLGFWQQLGIVPPTQELAAQLNRDTSAAA
jgi:ketosteroid isomerase-like protein